MKPALVFIHGIGGSSRVWPEQVKFFEDRYTVLCWNIPGYGGRRLPEEFSFVSIAATLADDLDAFGIEQCAVVGHSFGGMIAQQMVRDHPHRLTHLVLSGTSPAFGRPDGDFQKQFVAERLGPLDAGRTMTDMAPGIVKSLVAPGADAQGMRVAEESMAAVTSETYRASMKLLVTFDLRADLGTIDVPTLVLAAEHDASAPAPMMKRMAERIPAAVYAEIADAGHLANLERPTNFNQTLDNFLEGRLNG